MDRNLKEAAVRNSNEIHENDGSANIRMRAKCPLWARIVLACGAVLLLLVAGVAVRFDYVQSGHRIIECQYQSGSG